MKLIGLGLGVANVEQDKPPYRHARVLYTDADVPGDNFHGSVSRLGEYAVVWRCMLTEPALQGSRGGAGAIDAAEASTYKKRLRHRSFGQSHASI